MWWDGVSKEFLGNDIPVPSLDDPAAIEECAVRHASTISIAAQDDQANQLAMFVEFILARHHPEVAWRVITRAIDLAKPADVVLIGACDLEDLLSNHSAEYLQRSLDRALANPAFRKALECVWQHKMPAEDWQRLEEFRRAHPVA